MTEENGLTEYWVNTLFERGIDLFNRRIWLGGDLTLDSGQTILKGLQLLDSINNNDIKLYLDSYGGDYMQMLAIVDMMQLIKSDVSTIAAGNCQSAAALICAAGTPGKRFSLPSTSFMIHEGTVELEDVEGRTRNLDGYAKECKRVQTLWAEYKERFTKKPKSWWMDLNGKVADTYWSAAQAKRYGLIDHIL